MGNADLRELAVINQVNLEDIRGSTVAVDAHNWLYKYLTTTTKWTEKSVYTTQGGKEVANLIGIIQGLPKFLELDITPIFVFDGNPPQLKRAEIESRKKDKKKAEEIRQEALESGNKVKASKFESRSQYLTDTILDTSIELLERLDIPTLRAPSEAEAQCAYMSKNNPMISYAVTDDYDALLYGSPVTLRDVTGSGSTEVMDSIATRDEYDVTRQQLVDIAILCGTDYNSGVTGYGPKTAVKTIKQYGDIWTVMEQEDISIHKIEEVRQLLLSPDIISEDEYNIDTSINPQISVAQAYVTTKWEVDIDEVATGFDRIESSTSQADLTNWT